MLLTVLLALRKWTRRWENFFQRCKPNKNKLARTFCDGNEMLEVLSTSGPSLALLVGALVAVRNNLASAETFQRHASQRPWKLAANAPLQRNFLREWSVQSQRSMKMIEFAAQTLPFCDLSEREHRCLSN